jgi:MSHA pilin protein MshA
MKKPSILKRQDGFTLIEIIAVLVLLGILAAVAVPKFINLQAEAEEQSVAAVKAELISRANQFYALYLLDNTDTQNSQSAADWVTNENDLGADFSISSPDASTITVTVTASGNTYNLGFTAGVSATDGTGSPALFTGP